MRERDYLKLLEENWARMTKLWEDKMLDDRRRQGQMRA